jgi:hypothetical protein
MAVFIREQLRASRPGRHRMRALPSRDRLKTPDLSRNQQVAPSFWAPRFVRNVCPSSGFPRTRQCAARSPAARIVEQPHRMASAGRYRAGMGSRTDQQKFPQ